MYFAELSNSLCSKDLELKQLKVENVQLSRQLLQMNAEKQKPIDKTETLEKPSSSSFVSIGTVLKENIDDGTNLNIALNSEQIFELSELNNSNYPENDQKNTTDKDKNINSQKKICLKKNDVNLNKVDSQLFYYSADQDEATCSSSESWMPANLRPHKLREINKRKNCGKRENTPVKRSRSNEDIADLNKSVETKVFEYISLYYFKKLIE